MRIRVVWSGGKGKSGLMYRIESCLTNRRVVLSCGKGKSGLMYRIESCLTNRDSSCFVFRVEEDF